ncbi:MAG: hypothetical protein A2X36_17040 [Elusimicrobia bacterium GWA2_69_24]|nr:MAG: hypothetical protein A2X36_17040 [Elusimicrobia bacterium GWA2_69_24]
MRDWTRRILKKATASALSGALILTTPGFTAYQALAAEIVVPQVNSTGPSGMGAAGVAVVGSMQAPLGGAGLSVGGNLQTVLPSVPSANLSIPQINQKAPAALRAAGVVPSAQADGGKIALQGWVGAELVQRAAKAERPASGLFGVLMNRIRPQEKGAGIQAEKLLTPTNETLANPAASKSWGGQSFAALLGEKTGANPAASLVEAGVTAGRGSGLLPSLAGQRKGVGDGGAPPAPASAASAQAKTKKWTMIIGGVVGVGFMAYNLFQGKGLMGGLLGGLSSSWPVFLAIQVGLGLAMHFGKKWYKAHQAKKAEEKTKQAAGVNHAAKTLGAAEAADALTAMANSGTHAEVSIFNYTTSEFFRYGVTPDLIDSVRKGQFKVTTDDTGAVFLVPNLAPEKKAEAEKPAGEAKETAETQAQKEGAAGALEVKKVEEKPAKTQPVAKAPAHAPDAIPEAAQGGGAAATAVEQPVRPAPRSKAGLYGAIIGAVLGGALSIAAPVEAILVPLIGWMIGELFGVKRPARRSVSVLFGTIGATVLSSYFIFAGVPFLVLFPAAILASVGGYYLDKLVDSLLYSRRVKAAARQEAENEKAVPPPQEEKKEPVADENGIVAAASPVGKVVQAPKLSPVENAPKTEAPKVEAPKTEPVKETPTPDQPAKKGNNPSGLSGAAPASFLDLPESARGLDTRVLAEGKSRAQARARKLASDARLVRVAVNLDDPRAQVIYIFHSRSQNKVITVWKTRVGVKSDAGSDLRTANALWDTRLDKVQSLQEAYAALKRDAHWFKPTRVEIVSKWKGDPEFVFKDAQGRERRVKVSQAQDAAKDAVAPLNAPPALNQPLQKQQETAVSPAKQTSPAGIGPPSARAPPGALTEGPPGPRKEGAPETKEAKNSPHVSEDWFGFRRVRGLRHSEGLGALPADASIDRIIEQISRQFSIERAKVLELGTKYAVTLNSPRASWFAVYDALQKANRQEFDQLDQRKYEGGILSEALSRLWVKLGWKDKVAEAGFRKLANRQYTPGWRGALARSLEVQKGLLGVVVRFPYHLFDMFVFGYFRRAISFQAAHSTEDFLTIADRLSREKAAEEGKLTESMKNEPPLAERWLESAFQNQMFSGVGFSQRLNASAGMRTLRRWLIDPLLSPLVQFVWRRATMAIFSAVAMGLVGGLVPLPILAFHVTAIPLLGPALMVAGHGLPTLAAGLPFVGGALSLILGNAVNAILEDMTLGSLVNALTLSSILTFPAALKARLMDDRLHRLGTPKAFSRAFFHGVLGTAVSWKFWSMNLKSMFGLMIVGAEIEGVMTYAGSLDGFFNPAYKAVTGTEFKLFHTVAAAVERPEGQSPIPFGGAISWGNILVYKFQNLLGFNITDRVYGFVHGMAYGDYGDTVGQAFVETRAIPDALKDSTQMPGLDAQKSGAPGPDPSVSVVATLVGAAGRGALSDDVKVKPGTPQEMRARAENAKRSAGEIREEMARVQTRIGALRDQISGREQRLSQLEKESKPVSAEEEARYQEVLRQLDAKRDEGYVQSKLSEIYDIKNPREGSPDLKALEELTNYYYSLLPAETGNPGAQDAVGVQVAVLKMVEASIARFGETRQETRSAKPAGRVDEELGKRIAPLVDELERLRANAKGELANRDAIEKLLAAVARTRNMALKERRGGTEMLEFHKNLAKLATVMDLAFSLNTIDAAMKAIEQMQAMLDKKLADIRAVQDQAAQDQTTAEQHQTEVQGWKDEVQAKVDGDKLSRKDMLELEEQTRLGVEGIGQFRTEIQGLIARINAEDSGGSADPLTEYNRRLNLLPTLKEWYTNGKPGDPEFRSLPMVKEKLAEVEADIVKVNDGIRQIGTAPQEFAGILVIAVPGVPSVTVNNPSQAQTLQILNDRKAYWQGELAGYRTSRDEFRNRMSATYGGTEVDDFGEARPLALPRFLSAEQDKVRRYSAETADLAARVDAVAAKIKAVVPGANLPSLSGLDLKAVGDAIDAYPDRLKTIEFPSATTPEVFKGKMALLELAQLLPKTGRSILLWTEADATVKAVQAALDSPVPQVLSVYERAVETLEAVVADVDADVAFVNGGAHTAAQNQALIDRKRALMERILPMLQEARDMMKDDGLPFIQESIKSVDPNGDSYAKLFKTQVRLYNATLDVLNKTVPWALAAAGAPEGNVSGALAGIETWRVKYNNYLTGYDDDQGHHTGVQEYLDNIAKWKDPNNTETETIYGQVLPVSLPRLIEQMTAEQAQRAGQINTQHGEINDILTRLESLTGGKYGLAAKKLPTGIQSDNASSLAVVDGLADSGAYTNLADVLSRIGNDYKDLAGSVNVGTGGGSTVPQGTQPSPTVDQATQILLLAIEAAKRIVPSSQGTPESAPAAYAVARYLYTDAARDSARKNLFERIPVAEVFLNNAKTTLGRAIADLDKDKAYVNGGSETPNSIFDRKIQIYGELNAVTRAGADLFGQKINWDTESFDTVNSMQTYYDSSVTIYSNSGTVTSSEIEAIQKMKEALQKTYDELKTQKTTLTTWMSQLNDPQESALNRIAQDLRKVQEKTRAVLEQNVAYRDLEERLKRSQDIVGYTLGRIDDVQGRLSEELKGLRDASSLSPDLRRRIDDLRIHGNSWYMPADTKDASAALVIPKKDFGKFLETLFSSVLQRTSPTQDLSAMRQQLLENPSSLSNIIPNADVLEFGDADGFYLVYQTQFAVPHGLETSNWVTLGNVAQVWGNNISVTGYQFGSPPNDENAPWGDKGVEVQIESLQGKNWVNYLNIDFHRFIQDIPPDTKMASSARQSRLLVFNDFAVLLFGDRLYIAATGFGDVATDKTGEKPYFYGGSLKTSLKFTEVVRLNAEQQQVFAKDPRYFLETVNLDFTGLDPDLNQDYVIESHGENKHYKRTQIGPSFDVSKMISDKAQDAFTVDLYWARQEGTDDYDQDMLGVSVLKGFTLRDDKGKPWMVISNKAGAEMGTQYNTYSDKVSVTLPNQGIVVSAEGRLIGDAKTYYLEGAKKMGANSNVSVGYGNRYVGQEPRLYLTMNSAFTLGELWRAVSDQTADEMQGSKALKQYNKELDDFFSVQKDDKRVSELEAVFRRDIGAKLVQQDIGSLAKEIEDLRKAGALLDNTRIRGMVGFVTNPVGDAVSDRAMGGGFTAGTETSLTMTKTQKARIDAGVQKLYRESLRLQFRMLDLTKQWQENVSEIAQAQWELKLAHFAAKDAPTEALRAEGRSREKEAELRLHQATIKYNMLSGRSPDDALPFNDLTVGELQSLIKQIRATVSTPDGLIQVLRNLDPEAVQAQMGDNPFNLMDWVPFIEKLTFSVGVQFQDAMANQALGLGVTLRLPFYDPASKERDHAYRFESQATIQEMLAAYEEYGLRAQKELAEAKSWSAGAGLLGPRLAASADGLADAIRQYRNGMIPESRLRSAFDQWRWYASSYLLAESRSALTAGWSGLDGSFGKPRGGTDKSVLRIGSFQDAFSAVAGNSRSLAEIEARRQGAERMTEANNRRIQKFYTDLHLGYNITADGVGWLPSFGLSGFGVTPILTFELKTAELADLQGAQGKGEVEYYEQSKAKLEADLTVDFYRNALVWAQAGRSIAILEGQLIPSLQAALTRAQREAAPGDPEGLSAKAQKDLDGAVRRLHLARQMQTQALATLNHLLNRPSDAPIDFQISPEGALAELRAIFADQDPLAADRAVLASRVRVARAVETMVDKNLKVEELRLEPVSLVVRSLGRIIHALGDPTIGNPDLMAAARVQTLNAERSLEAFDGELIVKRSQLQTELAGARSALAGLQGRTDPAARLDAMELEGKILLLEAALARLGADPAAGTAGSLPADMGELERRVVVAEQSLAYAGKKSEVTVFQPETLTHDSGLQLRYFRANTTLGGDRIDKDYVEGWVELRLKNMDTPSEVLLALGQLRIDKADRMHRNTSAAAEARAKILVSQFSTNVRLLRWAESLKESPASKDARRDMDGFIQELRGRLEIQGGRIKALLGLPAQTSVDQLATLVPADRAGTSGDLSALARQFVDEAGSLRIDQLRRSLFEGGVPAAFGSEDGLSQQIRADVIAERMSYKGFTPVAAFGMFRGRSVGAAFLEAPDPRAIESSLQRVLSDSVRKELESQGRMQEMSLRLHLLMSGVADRSQLVESLNARVAAEEKAYRISVTRYEAGQANRADLFSAQDALVRSWLELGDAAAQLKNDFIELVTELEAIGYSDQKLLKIPASRLELPEPGLAADPAAAIADYGTRRMLDKNFSEHLLGTLRQVRGIPPKLLASLEKEAETYRAMTDAADQVRHHADIDPAKKFELLTQADVEGRRGRVMNALAGVLASVSMDVGARREVLGLFAKDLEFQLAGAVSVQGRDMKTLKAMRLAFIAADALPHAVQGAVDRLEPLHDRMLAAKQALLEEYMLESRKPTEFIIRDAALDRYLKAAEAYDAEVVKTFQMAEVRGDAVIAKVLDSLYSVRESIARERGLARHGRGMQALDALIMLEDARLAALRYQRAAPADFGPAYEALQNLKDLRSRWESKDAAGLEAVYALTETDAAGRRLWTTKDWLTETEVRKFIEGGQVTTDDQGRMWLTAKPGETRRLEIVSGVDAALARRDAARGARDGNALNLEMDKLFQTSEFALVGLDGKGTAKGMSYAEAFEKAQNSQAFYFSRRADGSGLHAAIHPLRGLWSDPGATLTVLYTGSERFSRDRFPTLESLQDHIARTDRLGRTEEGAKFLRLEAGPQGVASMVEAAREHERRSKAQGWVGLKLQSYGFAVDRTGKPVQLYLTQDEFDRSVKDLRESERIFADSRIRMEKAKVEADAADRSLAGQKEVTDAESLRFHVFERELRARLTEQVHEDPDFVRKAGENDTVYAGRIKARVDELLVKDKDYKREQERYSESVEAYNKLEEKAMDARRNADKALRALKDAGRLIAHSDRWETTGAAYLDALKKAGLDEEAVQREEKSLTRQGPRRLFIARDLSMTFDSRNALVSVLGRPVFGREDLYEKIADPVGPIQQVAGEVFAAVMDRDGTVVHLYMDMDVVAEAGKTWAIEDLHSDAKGGSVRYTSGGTEISPTFRLKYYVDTVTGLPVMLNRRYMISTLQKSGKEFAQADSWSYAPMNWGNIIMELPRGIVQAPIELLTGRDPNQNGFLGKAHMYKLEGGATQHHGFIRSFLGKLDVLELMPDPVDWYFDASQFPQTVKTDSPILPGQTLYDKSVRAGDKDIHFGRLHTQRTIVYETENLVSANRRVLSFFAGGVENAWMETRRGRDGTTSTSRLSGEVGLDALESALDDAAVANDPASYVTDGDNPVILSGNPGSIAVDRVERRLRLRPGSDQYQSIAERLQTLPERIAERTLRSQKAAPGLEESAQLADQVFDGRLAERNQVRDEEAKLWDEAHTLAWRIGAQKALEAEMTRIKAELVQLRSDLQNALQRMKELEAELAHALEPGTDPNDPNHPDPLQPIKNLPWWVWAVATAALAGAALAIWQWLRRRNSEPRFA